MTKYEYTCLVVQKLTGPSLLSEMNSFGEQGWETYQTDTEEDRFVVWARRPIAIEQPPA